MAFSFLKKYGDARDQFHLNTKKWPQLRKSSDGREKASGIVADLTRIDAILGSGGEIDRAALATAYQSFEKHARTYAQQIDAKPGQAVLDWMKKTAPVPKDEEKTIVDESRKFGKQIEQLIQYVENTVKDKLAAADKSKDKAKVLEALKAEALNWNKYANHDGVAVVMSADNAVLIPNPRTGKAAVDIVQAGVNARKHSLQLAQAVERIKSVSIGGALPGATARSAKALDQATHEARDAAIQLVQILQVWCNEYTQVMAAHARANAGAPHPRRPQVEQLMAKVEAAKQGFMKLDLKAAAASKAFKAMYG